MVYPEPHYTVNGRGPSYPNTNTTSATLVLAKDASGNLAYVSASQLQTTLDGNGLATDADIVNLQTQITSGSFDKVHATNNGNGTNFKVGDDLWIGDVNTVNTMQVSGQQDATKGYIKFGSGSATPVIGTSGVNHLNIANIPTYANKAAALSGGLVAGDIYRNGDNICIVF
jgi:hypothetical protein